MKIQQCGGVSPRSDRSLGRGRELWSISCHQGQDWNPVLPQEPASRGRGPAVSDGAHGVDAEVSAAGSLSLAVDGTTLVFPVIILVHLTHYQ